MELHQAATVLVIFIAAHTSFGAPLCQDPPPPAGAGLTPAAPAAPPLVPKTGDRPRTIYVTEGPENAPAPGAKVDIVATDPNEVLLWDTWPNFFVEPDPAGRRPVMTFTSDENGQVRVPKFPVGARARGTKGKLLAEEWFGANDFARSRLRLRPAVEVLVVDGASGAPQSGVTVVLGDRQDYGFAEKICSLTGADGRAFLPPPPRGPDRRRAAKGPAWLVTTTVPLSKPVVAPIEPDTPPSEPVRLALPPVGRLKVRLVQSDGQLYLGAAVVRVRPYSGIPEQDVERWDGGVVSDTVAAQNGVADFPRVAPDWKYCVSVEPCDGTLSRATSTVQGPPSPGEEKVADIACGHPALRVAGRLLGRDGKPAKRLALGGVAGQPECNEVLALWTRLDIARCITDDGGRFCFRFDVDPAAPEPKEIVLAASPASRSWPMDAGVLRIPVPSVRQQGVVELGDVGPPAGTVFATGTVVDRQGQPVIGANITVLLFKNERWGPAVNIRQGLGFERSRAKGQFELLGTAEPDDYGLVATKDGWFCPAPVPFEPGDHDLRIVLDRAGALSGSLLPLGLAAGEAKWHQQLHIEVVPAGETGAGDGPSAPTVGCDGDRFSSNDLRPGTYTIRITDWNDTSTPLLVIEGVEVKSGETNRDVRLQDIDLSAKILTRTISVTDEGGAPLTGALVALRPRSEKATWSPFFMTKDGKAVVICPAETFDALARMPGFRSAWTSGASADITLMLRRALPLQVTLRLDDGTVLPAPPLSLTARLRWRRESDQPDTAESRYDDPRNTGLHDQAFGAGRTVTFIVADPGVYEVKLSIMRDGRVVWAGLDSGSIRFDGEVTVVDAGTPEFIVHPDSAEVERAIKVAMSR